MCFAVLALAFADEMPEEKKVAAVPLTYGLPYAYHPYAYNHLYHYNYYQVRKIWLKFWGGKSLGTTVMRL